MARRNIFQPPPPPPAQPAAADETRPRFPNTGAMSGVKSTLRDLSSNAVRELDPALIDDDGPKDRLAITDADVAELAESIRLHGQQVPIMVRPLPDAPGRYRVVYGRRRLRALRLAGMPAKALVRSLTDEQAILAQGQENSLRLDPSFIEKAVFVAELADAGYDAAVVMDALAIDKPMLSRMTKVARTIPTGVIRLVGPAHGVGRRRWEELADLARDHGLDLDAIAAGLPGDLAQAASDDRFARLYDAATRAVARDEAGADTPPALPLTDADGATIGEMKASPRALSIRLARVEGGFADWLRDNAEEEFRRLHARWKASRGV